MSETVSDPAVLGNIRVIVIDVERNPVNGATVTLVGATLPTPKTGITQGGQPVSFPGLPLGTYTASVNAPGYSNPNPQTTTVVNTTPVVLTFVVNPQ